MITEPGIYPDITPTEYHGDITPARALSASGIKCLLTKTPAEFLAPPKPSNAALRKGDVAHQIALGKGKGFAIGEFATWASNAAKQFKEDAEAAGLTPIKRAEYDEAVVYAAVMKERIERTLRFISGEPKTPAYHTEVVAAWIEDTKKGPIWCKLMADVWCPSIGVILDPKFTTRLGDGVFENHATAMGWDIQDAWYRRGFSNLLSDMSGRIRFLNLCVSPDAPHVSRAREACEATRYSCEMEIERARTIFAHCQYDNNWPGYPDMIEPWTAKSWTLGERAARAMESED